MTQSAIAKSIGVHKSTISREIARNTGKRSYRYKQTCLLVKDNPCQGIKSGVEIEQQVNKAVALLTNRPRKSLDYQTP